LYALGQACRAGRINNVSEIRRVGRNGRDRIERGNKGPLEVEGNESAVIGGDEMGKTVLSDNDGSGGIVEHIGEAMRRI